MSQKKKVVTHSMSQSLEGALKVFPKERTTVVDRLLGCLPNWSRACNRPIMPNNFLNFRTFAHYGYWDQIEREGEWLSAETSTYLEYLTYLLVFRKFICKQEISHRLRANLVSVIMRKAMINHLVTQR